MQSSFKFYTSMLTYQACGAAGTVTGSMHVFTYTNDQETFRFAIDAGTFQTGEIMSEVLLNGTLLVDPKTIDAWILSHAHLDHTGRLAYVVKRGFSGPIYATHDTQRLAYIVMTDAVGQMRNRFRDAEQKEYEAIHNGRLPEHSYEESDIQLYDDADVDQTISQFTTKHVGEIFTIHPNLSVEFFDAAHILGSVFMRITEISTGNILWHSADLGFSPKPFLKTIGRPTSSNAVQAVFMESTYGDRVHESTDPRASLIKEVGETLRARGQVIIPSFAIQRSQELLYYFSSMIASGQIPKVNVYLDSPMAIAATEVYTASSDQARETVHNPNIKLSPASEQSKELNYITEPCIIIAGSGMMNGGRIWQHLRFHGSSSRNKLLQVGYQAVGTHGREIGEGKRDFMIDNRSIHLKLAVVKIDGFSGHADQNMLLKWLGDCVPQTVHRGDHKLNVYLIHGEPEARKTLAHLIQSKYKEDNLSVFEPLQGQEFTIFK